MRRERRFVGVRGLLPLISIYCVTYAGFRVFHRASESIDGKRKINGAAADFILEAGIRLPSTYEVRERRSLNDNFKTTTCGFNIAGHTCIQSVKRSSKTAIPTSISCILKLPKHTLYKHVRDKRGGRRFQNAAVVFFQSRSGEAE